MPSLDLGPVPPRAVLVGEQHEGPVGAHPGVATRVDEQHQREQPGDPAFVRQQPVE